MKTVLIVEDDPAISDLIAEVFNDRRNSANRAYSGSEALLVLQRRHPDLILLDLMLPGISGRSCDGKCSGYPGDHRQRPR